MTPPKAPAGKSAAAAKGPKTQPRDYIVCREFKASELADKIAELIENNKLGADATVLVELGHASARTPKEARRSIAKAACDEAELAEAGVPLNAVPARALTSGRGTVKMRSEPVWDD